MKEFYEQRIQECQNLIEENRRLLDLSGMCTEGGQHHAASVEAVILQSHVDTLQWQLKQVESSRQMYRALVLQVVHFLERCHRSLDTLVMVEEPIARSKSSHHVHQDADSSHLSSDNDQSVIASPSPPPSNKSGLFPSSRLRSSTIDAPKLFNRNVSTSGINSTMQTAGSYTNFRDFTWRRSRKPFSRASATTTMELDPEKLSQEAFRLLRTANNLLNTTEPALSSMPKSIFDSTYSSPTPSPHTLHQSLNSSFCRKSNGRSSDRSCCDSTSSSTSSSGVSSAAQQKAPLLNNGNAEVLHRMSVNGATAAAAAGQMESQGGLKMMKQHQMIHSEAESGFSSISSFQEIGLPLVHLHSMNRRACDATTSSNSDDSTTECDLTVQAGKGDYHHRRCDSAPALPPKKSAMHSFVGGEEALRVLWV